MRLTPGNITYKFLFFPLPTFKDFSLSQLHQRHFSKEDISRVLRGIKLVQCVLSFTVPIMIVLHICFRKKNDNLNFLQHPDMLQGLRLAQQHNSDFCIISDANTVYIDEILKVRD